MHYKVLFVGLGSIGNRHLGNLQAVLQARGTSCSIDALRTSSAPHRGIDNVYTATEDLPDDYDIAFITNPTQLHYQMILNLQGKVQNLFIEKPIFADIRQNCVFAPGVNYIACPLRFHPAIVALREFVRENSVFAFRALCSSYLPEWRQGQDYRQCYSARQELGGGVALDLIHEIDYLQWVFGRPQAMQMAKGHKSSLEISSDDIAAYIFTYPGLLGSLHLDYFGRYATKARREVEVFTAADTVTFDITNCRVVYGKTATIQQLPTTDIYQREMEYFIDTVELQRPNYYNDPEEALRSLQIALGAL